MSVDNGSTMSLPIDDDTTMVVSHEWPWSLTVCCHSLVFVQENVMCQLTMVPRCPFPSMMTQLW